MLDRLKRIAVRGLLYIGLAFAFLAVAGVLGWVSVHWGIRDLGPWIFPVGYTGLLLYAVIAPFEKLWHRPVFWIAVAGLVALHFLGFIFLLRHYPMWQPVWYIAVVIVEAALFSAILTALFRDWRATS